MQPSVSHLHEAFAGLIWQQIGVRLLGHIRRRQTFLRLFEHDGVELVASSLAWWKEQEQARPTYPPASHLIEQHQGVPHELTFFQLPVVDEKKMELKYWWVDPEKLAGMYPEHHLGFPFDDARRVFGLTEGPRGPVKGFRDCRVPVTTNRIGLAWSAAQNVALYLPDLRPFQSSAQSSEPETDILWGVGSALYLPVELDGQVIGVIVLYSPIHGLFGPHPLVERSQAPPGIPDCETSARFFGRIRRVIKTVIDLPNLLQLLLVIDEVHDRRQEQIRQHYEITASHEDKGRLLPALSKLRLRVLDLASTTGNQRAADECQAIADEMDRLYVETAERVTFVLGAESEIECSTAIDAALDAVESRYTRLLGVIERQIDPKASHLAMHPYALKCILKELIDNALAAPRSDGSAFKIEVIAEPGDWNLVVRDHGAGIDPDLLPRKLFEPYCSTRSREAQHYGIGLWNVQRIVEEIYGGTIEAENWDGGAVFKIRVRRRAEGSNGEDQSARSHRRQ